ncbi:MAG: GPO family capsid scaffolding protein [Thiobacillus sp.]|nr:GPO family capsid scaffolding protein [Thiobacillus sp.]
MSKTAAAKKFASKWFRVATAGATVDGRTISADHLKQMAKNYKRDLYGARVWLEHLRGVLPDSVFKALGDVTALKTEEVDGKTRLFAQIEPLPSLVAMNKAGQKIFTSIEIEPKFADTGEAYFMGLAVTDSPASLGTEALSFSVKARRPDDFKNHLFSTAEETEIEFEEVADDAPAQDFQRATSALEKLAALFTGKVTKPDPKPETQTPGTFDAAAFGASMVELQTALAEDSKATAATLQKLSAKVDEQARTILEFKGKLAKLDAEPEGGAQGGQGNQQQFQRQRTGGPNVELTDC